MWYFYVSEPESLVKEQSRSAEMLSQHSPDIDDLVSAKTLDASGEASSRQDCRVSSAKDESSDESKSQACQASVATESKGKKNKKNKNNKSKRTKGKRH